MDKEKVLYWYYTVKDTFTPDHIENDQDLKEKFVSIEIYLLKNYGKIDDLSLSEAVELKLKVPKKHYGIDYKAFIAKLDTNPFKSRYLFKRLNDRIIKKYFDYRIKRNLKGVQIKLILLLGKLMELKGSKIEFFFPNEKEIGELYRICIDGERKGSREAKKDREAIDELINTVKPDFDEKLLELIEEIESKKHKDKTETKPSAPKPRKVPEKEFFDLFDRLQKDNYEKTEKDRELLEHPLFKVNQANYLKKIKRKPIDSSKPKVKGGRPPDPKLPDKKNKLRKEYYQLTRVQGYKSSAAIKTLSKIYKWTQSTIKTYLR